ncbi:iron-containing alcohol dehydrogenase [Solidesulfovibrio sp. C21]|uniref:iron-containing alcohol dehydrogenase n=1 Tax=Solidesulfovibrio sp. C21 TaxID=3398613 RepID=UPI0039FD93D8
MAIHKFTIPEIIFGRGSFDYAGVCAKQLGASKIFVVSDPGVEAAGWVDRLMDILKREGLESVYCNDVAQNPKDHQVKKGVALYRQSGADVVLALGGGSVMDAAKGIALVASNGGEIKDYEGANQVKDPLPPMVFIPSTMGSESNISQFAVVTDVARRIKMTIISRTLVPNISITDPNLLGTLSRELLLAPLFDALAHAVESYLSPLANPLTEVQSLKGLDLLWRHSRPALATLSLDELEQLTVAGLSSGIAFTNASVGLGHALAHALGGMYDVVHGVSHALLLPSVMRYNQPECEAKMAVIGRILLGERLESDAATAEAGIAALERFREEIGLPTRLREVLPDNTMLPKMSRNAAKDICLLTNPRPAAWKDILNIYYGAW